MYISSTNIYLSSPEYLSNIPANLINSEKYYNCDFFVARMNQRGRNLFHKITQLIHHK